MLDSQRRRADSQIAYYRALCEYNKLLALIHRRKGSMLDYAGIVFAEGPWPKKAYWDALGHARRRDAAKFMNYGWSRPNVVSHGAVPQGKNIGGSHFEGNYVPTEAARPLEELAPPQPSTRDADGQSVLQATPRTANIPLQQRRVPSAVGSGVGVHSGPQLLPADGDIHGGEIRVPGRIVPR
jgi:hypothetical protein